MISAGFWTPEVLHSPPWYIDRGTFYQEQFWEDMAVAQGRPHAGLGGEYVIGQTGCYRKKSGSNALIKTRRISKGEALEKLCVFALWADLQEEGWSEENGHARQTANRQPWF